MAFGVDTALIAALAVTAVAGAATAVVQGEAAADQADSERQQYEESAKQAQIQADQEEVAKRKQLTAALSSADALRAGRGLDLGSPTGDAIRNTSIENAEADITTIRANAASNARRLGLAGDAASARGDAAQIAGYGSAVNQLGSAAVSGYRLSGTTGGGPTTAGARR